MFNTEKNENNPRKKRWGRVISGILVLLYGVPIIIFIAQSSNKDGQTGNSAGVVAGLFLFAALLATAILLVYWFIKFTIRHRWKGLAVFLALVILIVIVIGINNRPNYQKSIAALPDIQDSLTQIAAAKIMGDAVVAKKPIPGASVDKVNADGAAATKKLTDLSVPQLLKAYQQSAILWANQIAVSAQMPEIRKDLPSQPGDFSLALTDSQAAQLFQDSLKKIAGLKKDGHTAVQKKDRDAMRLVAAKLVVQEHWLNGLLHSQSAGALSLRLVPAVIASTLDVPPVGPGEDVTCQVCADPKVHWTAQLRKQYGCDTRCKPQQPAQQQEGQTQQNRTNQAQEQNQTPQTPANPGTGNQVQNQQPEDQTKPYNYKDAPARKICIGRGGTSTGNSSTNMYCVEEAISSTNEIAASAIGFAAENKSITVNAWDNQFAEIEKIPEVAADQAGQAPSTPTTAGGHLEGGMGTVSTGEPTQPPKPADESAAETSGGWDGVYQASGILSCHDYRTIDFDCLASNGCNVRPDISTTVNFSFTVKDGIPVGDNNFLGTVYYLDINGTRLGIVIGPTFSTSGGRAVASGTLGAAEVGSVETHNDYICASGSFTATRVSD